MEKFKIQQLAMLIVLFSYCLTISCKKDKQDQPKEPETEKPDVPIKREAVIGSITLPEGSNINVNTLTAISPIDELKLSNSQYSLEVAAAFSTELVTNTEGDIMLMGYSYPDEKDNVIDVKSTALAMVMNMPFCMSLNDEGKKQVISKAKSSVKFNDLVNQITNSIIKGKPATDETNTTLIQALADLISDIETTSKNPGIIGSKSGSMGKIMGIEPNTSAIVYPAADYFRPVPIKINTAASVLSFENNRLACSFAVGIYVDGKNEKSIVIPGTSLFAKNMTELFAGYFGNGYTEPFQELVTLQPDKDYEIRIRSGKPGLFDSSPEFKTAMLENVKQIVAVLLSNYLPKLSDLDTTCMGKYRLRTIQLTYQTFESLKNANQSNEGYKGVEIAGKLLSAGANTLLDCGVKSSFFKTIKKFFDFSSKVTKIAETANTTALIFDWFNSRPAIDTCFTIVNNKIVKCKPDPSKIEIVSGNNQQAAPANKLSDPLKIVAKDENGQGLEGIKVQWKVKSGNGTLTAANSTTDVNGVAQTEWTLGISGKQEVEAIVNKRGGSAVTGSPLTFKVSLLDSISLYEAAAVGKWTLTSSIFSNNAYAEIQKHIFNADGTGIYYFVRTAGGESINIEPGNPVYKTTWSISGSPRAYYLTITYPDRGWVIKDRIFYTPTIHYGIAKGDIYFLGVKD